jgi:hypothetical protein
MKVKRTLALALACACISPLALAERWMVNEGQRGEWSGVWNLRASSGNFPITMRSGGATLTAEGFYLRSGNVVSIARSKTSDGNDCHYMGVINGRAISGTVFCGSGGPYAWTAVIEDEPQRGPDRR